MSASKLWPNHDISSLKLLQVVCRHGDRTPVSFTANDPFSDEKYWSERPGVLTHCGRRRMYLKGQFIRQAYNPYLDHKCCMNEICGKSSGAQRCVETAQALIAGISLHCKTSESQQKCISNEGNELKRLCQSIPVLIDNGLLMV